MGATAAVKKYKNDTTITISDVKGDFAPFRKYKKGAGRYLPLGVGSEQCRRALRGSSPTKEKLSGFPDPYKRPLCFVSELMEQRNTSEYFPTPFCASFPNFCQNVIHLACRQKRYHSYPNALANSSCNIAQCRPKSLLIQNNPICPNPQTSYTTFHSPKNPKQLMLLSSMFSLEYHQ